jgi:hypothetical protein
VGLIVLKQKNKEPLPVKGKWMDLMYTFFVLSIEFGSSFTKTEILVLSPNARKFMFKKCLFLLILVVFETTAFAQNGEDLFLDLSISEAEVNGGDPYPLQGQEMRISCQQNLSPKTDLVNWGSVVGYFFSTSLSFDSTAILLAVDESSLGGSVQDEFDPEEATVQLPDSVTGVGYIYVIADYLGTFSHLESHLENNIVKIPIIIQEIPSGIPDEREEFLVLYPNPTSGVLNVKVPTVKLGQVFEVFDSSGNKVREIRSDQNNTSIDVSDLVAGVYLLHLSGAEKFQKFLVN